MTYSLVVHGPPRTKKNHGSVIQRGKRRFHIPSAAWTAWLELARIVVNGKTKPYRDNWEDCVGALDVPVNCRALFYRDANRGDAVGYYQGLADLLERRGIVANDRQLVSWDGSRLLVDREAPRVEIELTVVG